MLKDSYIKAKLSKILSDKDLFLKGIGQREIEKLFQEELDKLQPTKKRFEGKKNETIIAIDFDGTIVSNKYPEVGNPLIFAISTIKDLKKAGFVLILNTCREGNALVDAIKFCESFDLGFRSYNHNTKEDLYSGSRKVYANYYIDDRHFNMDGFVDWSEVREFFLS